MMPTDAEQVIDLIFGRWQRKRTAELQRHIVYGGQRISAANPRDTPHFNIAAEKSYCGTVGGESCPATPCRLQDERTYL